MTSLVNRGLQGSICVCRRKDVYRGGRRERGSHIHCISFAGTTCAVARLCQHLRNLRYVSSLQSLPPSSKRQRHEFA